jgi:hypothetical protein
VSYLPPLDGDEDQREPEIEVPICPNGHGNIYPELSYCKVCHHGRQPGEEFDFARYLLADDVEGRRRQ